MLNFSPTGTFYLKRTEAMGTHNNSINKIYVSCGVVICLCAITEFILWIVDASKLHMTNQIVMGCGLLSITCGTLFYLIVRPSGPRVANYVLWTTIIACIVLFFIGVALTPSAGTLGEIMP